MYRSESPAAILRLKHLEAVPQGILNNPIETGLGAFAPVVALVDPGQDGLLQPPELVTGPGPGPAPALAPSGLNGELPAGAHALVGAVVLAVAAGQEVGVSEDGDTFLGQPRGRIVEVFMEAE